MKSIQLNKTSISYEEEGEGEGEGIALLFIHGFPGRPQDFRKLWPRLSHFRCLSIALPGMGLSRSSSPEPIDMSDIRAVVDEFLEALNISHCVIMGHSLGGPVAVYCAAANPQRYPLLVLLNSVGHRPHKAFRRIQLQHWNRLSWFPGFLHFCRWLFSKSGFPSSIDVEIWHYILRCTSRFNFNDHHRQLQSLTQPSLIIGTTDDPLIEEEIFHQLGEITGGQTILLQSGGHNPQAGQSKEVAEALSAFIHQHWIAPSGL